VNGQPKERNVLRLRAPYFYYCIALIGNSALHLNGAHSYTDTSSRTFIALHPPYHNVKATSGGWQDVISADDDNSSALRIVGIYQKSRESSGIDNYFLIDCKHEILIAGDETPYYQLNNGLATATTTRDVRAEFLNLPATFSGRLRLCPTMQQAAAIVSYQYELGHFFEHSWFDNMWFIASVPFIYTKQGLNPCQFDIKNPGPALPGGPTDILSALTRPYIDFGRIITGECHRFSPSHISIGLGTTWTTKHDFLLIYQSTMDIATCSRNDPTYIFSPVIGPNGHLAWSNELDVELPLNPVDCPYTCKIMINMLNQYVFARSEIRTFDLKGKQWSRYLPMRNIKTGNTISSTELLTQEVRVHPRNFFNATGGVLVGAEGFNFEIGYMLWVHRGETLQFVKPCCGPNGFPIDHFYLPGSDIGKSASKTTIYMQAPDDDIFTPLHQNDVNLNSGSSTQAFTQSAYIELLYQYKSYAYAALGLWCENPEHNGAPRQWGIWLTAGGVF
jgi:hypothetical protein